MPCHTSPNSPFFILSPPNPTFSISNYSLNIQSWRHFCYCFSMSPLSLSLKSPAAFLPFLTFLLSACYPSSYSSSTPSPPSSTFPPSPPPSPPFYQVLPTLSGTAHPSPTFCPIWHAEQCSDVPVQCSSGHCTARVHCSVVWQDGALQVCASKHVLALQWYKGAVQCSALKYIAVQ